MRFTYISTSVPLAPILTLHFREKVTGLMIGLFYSISLAWQFILNKLTELKISIIVVVVCHCLHFAFLNMLFLQFCVCQPMHRFVSAALRHTDIHRFCMFSQYLCGLFSIVHIFELWEEVLIDTSIKSIISYSKLAMDAWMDKLFNICHLYVLILLNLFTHTATNKQTTTKRQCG